MPTANLKTGGVTTTTNLKRGSNDTLTSLNILTKGRREPCKRAAQMQCCGLEVQDSDFNFANKNPVKRQPYGKLTKTYEYRRRANLAKAREMAVKMENYKKHLETPLYAMNKTQQEQEQQQQEQERDQSPIKLETISARLLELPLSDETKPPNHIAYSSRDIKSARKQQKVEKNLTSRTNRSTGGGLKSNPRSKDKLNYNPNIETPRSSRHKNVECQTCAADSTSWQVLPDVKIMHPTPALWSAILKKREDDKRRAMLKEERYVPEYSKSEVNYQTNLKEFLETGVVRHYDREFENQHEEKLRIKSTKSDDLRRALRYRPRAKPEMDLKKRLPKIEEELLRAYKSRT